MLLRIDVLIRKPPFTNQLTHVEDEAAMAREIAAATQAAREPATLTAAATVAAEALSRDPDNPALAGVLEGVDLDMGDLEGALALARRAAALLPADFATSADEASILIRLGRFDEAGAILTRASASGADLDMLAPVFSDLWTRTRKFDEGLRFLDGAIARNPRDRRLRLVHAGLMRASGNGAGAEREFRAVLSDDPSNEDALESLVGLLAERGREGDAAKESLAEAAFQPRNQENSLRAAKAAEAGGDSESVVTNLLAAERSGPVNATFELTLALDLYKLHRMDEMMAHLEEARKLSLGEGNRSVTDSIEKLERRMRAEIGRPQAMRFRTGASRRG
jgi:tetratricopeptide (TPR) repeat protein